MKGLIIKKEKKKIKSRRRKKDKSKEIIEENYRKIWTQ